MTAASSTSAQADFEKIAKSLEVWPGSGEYRLLQFYFGKKSTKALDCKILIQTAENCSDEQLKILQLLCDKEDFTARNILDFVKLVKKFGIKRILMLRAFVDLDGVTPGSLNQFLMINLPLGDKKTMGYEAWENELRKIMMNQDQINVFYHICYRVPGITTTTAIAVLPRVRRLKQQHTQVINHFLKEDVYFGDKPIDNSNISGLINLWPVIPELDSEIRLKQLIKKLSRKSDKAKKDFLFIIQAFKEELEKEKRDSLENIIFKVRRFFDL